MNAIQSSVTQADSHFSPTISGDSRRSLRLAISDPGAFLARGNDYREPLIDWQVRAVVVAVGNVDVDALQAEIERLRAERHSTNESLTELTELIVALRASEARVAELTALLRRARDEARTANAAGGDR